MLLPFKYRTPLLQKGLHPFSVVFRFETGALAKLFKLYLDVELRVQPLVQRPFRQLEWYRSHLGNFGRHFPRHAH